MRIFALITENCKVASVRTRKLVAHEGDFEVKG